MTIVEHLAELRTRLIYSFSAVLSISVLAYFFRTQILEVLARPLGGAYFLPREQIPELVEAMRRFLEQEGASHFSPAQIEALLTAFRRLLYMQSGLIFIHPAEAFFAYLKLAFFTGLLLSAPFILYQVWRYVMPALYSHERRYFRSAAAFGTGLFFAGVAFAFFVVLPLGIGFLVRMGGPELQAVFTIGNYISFSMIFLIAFGLVFELPVVIYVLVKLGVVSRRALAARRKYVFVLAFVLAAVITPSVDPFTQTVTAVPLLLLYELSIFLARFAERRRGLSEQQEGVMR
ncbi:MAG: twin-arginine translocase subunit TatC [Candidatus Acetothermia bacterium]|nr:twin-arginine translocase subunit TatC [Candidatus Acetothermia bacterium]MDH7505812.1 twin-arginine translocase subunit TatC [Candidatus Acetothermia bacterium]